MEDLLEHHSNEKKALEINITAAKNEICKLYHFELQTHRELHSTDKHHTNFPTGCLDEIINTAKKRRKIGNEINITKKFVRKHIARNKCSSLTSSVPDTPLAPIEPKILKLILAMAEIREPLTPSRCIHLINDLVKGQPIQQDLIDFKKV